MKKLLGLMTLLMITLGAILFIAPGGLANAAPECNVQTDGTLNGENGPGRKFVVTNNRAFIGFKVKGGENCKVTVSLRSWYSPSRNGTPHEAQVKYQVKERTLGPGSYTMGVDLPPQGCFYQVDFVRVIPDRQPGQKNEMLGFTLNGTKNCIPTTPTPPQPPQPPQPPTPPTPPQPPVVPVYTCDALSVSQQSRTSFTFTTRYTLKDATLTSLVYVIYNSSGVEIARTANSTYEQANPASYKVKAELTVLAGGTQHIVTAPACEANFTVSPPNTPMCTIPGKEHLPANSPDCVETPVVTVATPPTPGALPETGIAESVASILGLGSVMAAGSYYAISRKHLLAALLSR